MQHFTAAAAGLLKTPRIAYAGITLCLMLLVVSQVALHARRVSMTSAMQSRAAIHKRSSSSSPPRAAHIDGTTVMPTLDASTPTPHIDQVVLDHNTAIASQSDRMCICIPVRVSRLSPSFIDSAHHAMEYASQNYTLDLVVVIKNHTELSMSTVSSLFSSAGVHSLRSVQTADNATLAMMINAGLRKILSMNSCMFVMVWDPSRVAQRASFLMDLVTDVRVSGGVAVSCSTLSTASRSRGNMPLTTVGQPHDRGENQEEETAAVFDRGFNLSLAQVQGKTLPTAARNYFGFHPKDQRVLHLEASHLLSPYCVMLSGERVPPHEILIPYDGERTLVDFAASGESSALHALRASAVLFMQQKNVSDELSKVSVVTVKKMGESSRSVIRQTFNAVLEAQKLLKVTNGDQWALISGSSFLGAEGLKREQEKLVKCRNADPVSRFACLSQLVETSMQTLKQVSLQDVGNVPEELFGWMLSMELSVKHHDRKSTAVQHNGGEKETHTNNASMLSPPSCLFVSGSATAWLDSNGAPDSVQPYFAIANRVHVVDQASVALRDSDALLRHYRAHFPLFFPTLFEEAPLRVVWDAYCCHCCGFSNEMVHLIHPLQKRMEVRTPLEQQCFCDGFPTAVQDSMQRLFMDKDAFPVERRSPNEFVIWISHTEPTRYRNDVFSIRRPDYVVGRSMYEFTRITEEWITHIAHDCDEVWVPAEFLVKSFSRSGVDPSKLVVIPEALDVYFFDSRVHKPLELPPSYAALITDETVYVPRQSLKDEWHVVCNHDGPQATRSEMKHNFKFFSNFKWEPRKGWDVLFSAYFSGFRKSDPVSLYILTHIWRNGEAETFVSRHNHTYVFNELKKLAESMLPAVNMSDLPHVCFIMDDLTEVDIARLYRSTDAFVLPTRGEGWGLPTIQAMSMGKPVITTAWGGQLEFLRPNNSFMISVDGLEEIPMDSEYFWEEGKKWALPSLRDTRALMQLVVRNTTLANAVGAEARRFVVEHFSEEAVVEIIMRRLQVIRNRLTSGVRSITALNDGKKPVQSKPPTLVGGAFHLRWKQ